MSEEFTNNEVNDEEDRFSSMSDEELSAYLDSNPAPTPSPSAQNEEVDNDSEDEDIEGNESEEPTENSSDEPTEDRARIVEEPTGNEDKLPEKTSIDYEAVYKEIFKPFKANGKTITPRTLDDITSLMQMGANYVKKMTAIKPMQRAVESLSKAGIGAEDLNFLIDIHKGDKEAIKTLIKKNQLDPMDLDLDSTNYTPNSNNIATDKEVEYADILTDYQEHLPAIKKILDERWDSRSKEMLMTDPKLMRALGEELELGRFEEIMDIVEEERALGHYRDVPIVQVYSDVVTKALQGQQMFAEEQKRQMYQQQQQLAYQRQQAAQQAAQKASKAKAAPTYKSAPKTKTAMSYDEMALMSDEDFEKLSVRDIV